MNKKELMDEILFMLRTVMEDQEKMEKIHRYMKDEFYEEMEEEEFEIPTKYKELVKSIAENTDMSMICYLNPESLEMIAIPSDFSIEGFWESEEEESDFVDEYELLKDDFKKIDSWEKYVILRAPESEDSYRIMEEFVDQLPESRLKNQLSNALNRSHPFRNFNKIIHQSDAREDWFAFKRKELEKRVYEELVDKGIIKIEE